jgi:hypothetical protein
MSSLYKIDLQLNFVREDANGRVGVGKSILQTQFSDYCLLLPDCAWLPKDLKHVYIQYKGQKTCTLDAAATAHPSGNTVKYFTVGLALKCISLCCSKLLCFETEEDNDKQNRDTFLQCSSF